MAESVVGVSQSKARIRGFDQVGSLPPPHPLCFVLSAKLLRRAMSNFSYITGDELSTLIKSGAVARKHYAVVDVRGELLLSARVSTG